MQFVFFFSAELSTQTKKREHSRRKNVSKKLAQDSNSKSFIFNQNETLPVAEKKTPRLNINWHARNKSHVLLEHDEKIVCHRSASLSISLPCWNDFY